MIAAGVITADLSRSIHGLAGRSAAADWLMSVAAQDLLYLAAAVLVALWFRPAALRAGLAAGLGGLVALGLAVALGGLHDEARPFVADHFAPRFPHVADGSFPSDHLAVLGAVTAGAWLGSRRLGYVAAALSLVVAFARVFAGVHYVGDVVAGFLVGVVSGLAVWFALSPAVPLLTSVDGMVQAHHLRPRTETA
jgi:membrane-associated phospholipid phosphatase